MRKREKTDTLNLFIVEDNAMYNFFLKYHVNENYRFRVFDFTTFNACIENAENIVPDIILLDYELPNIDGLQTIPLMRKVWPLAQIVVISSKVDEVIAAKLAKMNIAYCVAKKDCTVEALNKVIDEAVLRAQALL